MAKNFRAKQLEVSQIILSGGLTVPTGKAKRLGAMIYSGTNPPTLDRTGGRVGPTLAHVGSDVMLFVSGVIDGKNQDKGSVTLFGGDVVVSGTMYTEELVTEVTTVVHHNQYVSGSLLISNNKDEEAIFRTKLPWNTGYSDVDVSIGLRGDGATGWGAIAFDYKEGKNSADAFIAESEGKIYLSASDGYVFAAGSGSVDDAAEFNFHAGHFGPGPIRQRFVIFSGSDRRPTATQEFGNDTNFYVSGNIGGKDSNNTSIGVFGGDLHVSGNLSIGGTGAGLWTRTTDALHPTADLAAFSAETGTDINFFVSGSKQSAGTDSRGTALFGGDLSVSGTIHALGRHDYENADQAAIVLNGDTVGGRIVWRSIASGDTPHGQIYNNGSGDLILSASEEVHIDGNDKVLIKADGTTEYGFFGKVSSQKQALFNRGNLDIDFAVANQTHDHAIWVDAASNTVTIDRRKTGIPLEADLNFFVSGSRGARGGSHRGASLFDGDTIVSGSLAVHNAGQVGGTISGSIHHTISGSSYIKQGSGITVTSASNGQVTISATGGGGTMSSWTLTGDSGTQNVNDGQAIDIEGGTGINTVAGATRKLTVSLDYTGISNYIDSTPTDLEGTAIALADSIAYHDHSDDNVKKGRISDLPFMQNFTVSGDSGTETINSGNDLKILGGLGTDTAVSSTDTTTVNLTYVGVNNYLKTAGAGSPATNDIINFSDTDGSDIVKRCTISDLLALGGGGGGGADVDWVDRGNKLVTTSSVAITSEGSGPLHTADKFDGNAFFYVSGSRRSPAQSGNNGWVNPGSDGGLAVFGGDVIISGSIVGKDYSGGMHKLTLTAPDTIRLQTNDPQGTIRLQGSSLMGGAAYSSNKDGFFLVSGSSNISDFKSTTVRNTAVFGGHTVVSGAFETRRQRRARYVAVTGNSTNYYIAAYPETHYLEVKTVSSTMTVHLPGAAINPGRVLYIKKGVSSSLVLISPQGSDKINTDRTTISIDAKLTNCGYQVISDGVNNWSIMGEFGF